MIKFTEREIQIGNELIARFMGGKPQHVIYVLFPNGEWPLWEELNYHVSWDRLMPVIEKMERIGAHIDINPSNSDMCWWYSPSKATRFKGWSEPRVPFDAVSGKYYSRTVGVGDTGEKQNRETKLLANYDNVVYFIKWLNKNVPKSKIKELCK